MLKKDKYNFNTDWKFHLGDLENGALISLDDSCWRNLNIPHDWSVEFSFNKDEGEWCTAYLLGGIGWYRKHFISTENVNEMITYLNIDGIYNNYEVYVNEKLVGIHPYGYSPICYDISEYLNTDNKENILAIKVDHTRYADSRWYTGSGIYRKIEITTSRKLHIPVWGTYLVTNQIDDEKAQVDLEITIKNASSDNKEFSLTTDIISPNGEIVASTNNLCSIDNSQQKKFKHLLEVENPKLWSFDSTNLYKAITKIKQDGDIIQEYETPFGIRFFEFDADKGFFLNGKNTLIKGVCLHHDAGLVGAAVPNDVWIRRLNKLKECGCNAIRTAHNPSSKEFLDLCDEMGFLVQLEFYDEWDYPKDKRHNCNEQSVDYITRGNAEHFQEWAERDLKNTMLRDRNHPCIFQWSIGNEIEWTYEGNKEATGYFSADAKGGYFWTLPPYTKEKIRENFDKQKKTKYNIGKTAAKLAKWTREIDTTRPVIANCILPSASYESGYADALDIIGYSYRQVVYDYGHKNYPNLPIMGTENVAQWHEWKHVIERDFVSGIFIWTGIDYLGEARNKWPQKGTTSGLLDLAGFEKTSYHMIKTLWNDEPHIHITTKELKDSIYELDNSNNIVEKEVGSWKRRLWVWPDVNNHWNYDDKELIIVEVISNCESVELFINDKSLGIKHLADFEDRIFKWAVPFVSGNIVAVGKKNDSRVSQKLTTSDELESISLDIDKTNLKAKSDQVSHIVAQLVDKNQIPIQTIEKEIEFVIDGPCKLLGVDNGHCESVQDYQSNKLITYRGRGLLIIQATKEAGTVEITAKTDTIKSKPIKISIN